MKWIILLAFTMIYITPVFAQEQIQPEMTQEEMGQPDPQVNDINKTCLDEYAFYKTEQVKRALFTPVKGAVGVPTLGVGAAVETAGVSVYMYITEAGGIAAAQAAAEAAYAAGTAEALAISVLTPAAAVGGAVIIGGTAYLATREAIAISNILKTKHLMNLINYAHDGKTDRLEYLAKRYVRKHDLEEGKVTGADIAEIIAEADSAQKFCNGSLVSKRNFKKRKYLAKPNQFVDYINAQLDAKFAQ